MSDTNNEVSQLEESIKSIAEKEGYKQYKVKKQSVLLGNNNYTSSLYTVDIKGLTDNGEKETNLFIKLIKKGDNIINILPIKQIYNTEMYFYKELLKIYDKLQNEAHIPVEERFRTVKCYDETSEEVIIMENVTKKSYVAYPRKNAVSFKFAKMSLEEIAKFHALSFVLEKQKPEYFNRKIKTLKNAFILKPEIMQPLVDQVQNIIIDSVDDKYKNKIKSAYVNFIDKYDSYFKEESIKRCLCHSDYKNSNILVKFENGEVQEVIPIDFQIIQYGCPALDLLFFIYLGTDREFRKTHTSNLKDIYYEKFSSYLNFFDIDAQSVYSRKQFDKDYEDNVQYGLIVSLLALPFVFICENAELKMNDIQLGLDDRFKERMQGNIDDFIEWGYL